MAWPQEADHGDCGFVPGEGLGLTFRDSKVLPVHQWYPYVEGFSAPYIQRRLATIKHHSEWVYDPFGGAGTVNLEASQAGIKSCYSELNPYMRFVAETKINQSIAAVRRPNDFLPAVQAFADFLKSKEFLRCQWCVDLTPYADAFPDRDFFEDSPIRQLLAARDFVQREFQNPARDLLLLAISSELVACSNMTRRADLRRRRPGEYKDRIVDVPAALASKARRMAEDLRFRNPEAEPAVAVSSNSRQLVDNYLGRIDSIITSPPYLNGTNYFRNTKIELWFMGLISSETEIAAFNQDCVAGGISNVSRQKSVRHTSAIAESTAYKLRQTDGDKRIARLVELYYSDILEVLECCHAYLKRNGCMFLDIGDSKFYGVHVPTDEIVLEAARCVGFQVASTNVIARRHSRDKTPLKQVELVLKRVSG